jgi:hypothetical protein
MRSQRAVGQRAHLLVHHPSNSEAIIDMCYVDRHILFWKSEMLWSVVVLCVCVCVCVCV